MQTPRPPAASPAQHSRHASHAPHHPNLRLERWQRLGMYGVCFLLFASGLAWLLAHYLLPPADQFGAGVHPLEPWAMKVHGALAMLALFMTGSLLNNHIRRALKARRNRTSGWAMIVLLSTLTLSGYALYYLATEQNRMLWSGVHWVVGLAFSVLLIVHILLGRRARLKV